MTIPEKITVTATVKGAEMPGEGDKDYKVGLDIPAFKSKYPTTVYVPLDVSLKKGASYSIELLQGKKAKEDYKGDLHWHFMWKWGGLRTQVSAPAPAEAPKGQEHAPGAAAGPSSEKPPLFTETGYRTDPTGRSIERQVSLKSAVELVVARVNAGHYGAKESVTYHALQVADLFARWCQGELNIKQLPGAQAPEPAPDPIEEQAPKE